MKSLNTATPTYTIGVHMHSEGYSTCLVWCDDCQMDSGELAVDLGWNGKDQFLSGSYSSLHNSSTMNIQ